ncbi:hypothetical protein NKH77_25840 [Streptomyces sp. M19]
MLYMLIVFVLFTIIKTPSARPIWCRWGSRASRTPPRASVTS